jgi:hypothetical protein
MPLQEIPMTVKTLWFRRLAVAGVAGLLLAACGGGVDTGGTGVQQSYTSGTIAGFGSVIVNGVRFDDTGATVTDDDGTQRGRDDLRLGMTVLIESSPIRTDASGSTASANSIRLRSEIVGVVQSLSVATNSMSVLGQTVHIGPSTVFDGALSGGLPAVAIGAVVEVHGHFDPASGSYRASRIELKAAASQFRLRGIVNNLDAGARTFTVAGQTISYAALAAADVPAALANGRFVRLRLQTTKVGGAWVAVRLEDGSLLIGDREEARFDGVITTFTSVSQFSVNGVPIDASAASFPDGSAGLGLGARVEVEGRIAGGALRATRVKVESEQRTFELIGAVSALDTAAKTFVLRGVSVSYAGTVDFRNGTAADLANGRLLKLRGVLGHTGSQLAATRIEFN